MPDLFNVKNVSKSCKKGASRTLAVDRERYKFPPNLSNCKNILHYFQVTDIIVFIQTIQIDMSIIY